ncbi:MAG: YihY/virulence factor BrkB family protein [Acidobacteriia bacterium]|nr:YihY/virulence factor BrkB family protein [Terriglobia bacterium]MBV8904567.1 YihY/virulence factor BrkB family protein [Terriglobia bacterium]
MTAKSVWNLAKQTASNWSDLNAPHLGAALSFYTMFSMAPLLVISISIAGLVFGREAAQGQILWQIQNLVGPDGAKTIQTILQNTSSTSSGVVATVIGLVVLLFGASGVFGELRDSLNAVWGVKTPISGIAGFIRYRFFSFTLVLGIGFVLLVSLLLSAALAAAGKYFGSFLPVPEFVLQALNLLLSFLGITILFALLYKIVPDFPIAWSDVWIGAAVTSLLFSIGKLLIGLYLGKASVGSAYGAAGSLVILMVWIYYSSQIFFLGAEFTRIFSERHGSHSSASTTGAEPADLPDRRQTTLGVRQREVA